MSKEIKTQKELEKRVAAGLKAKITDDFQFKLWKENKLDQEYTMTLGEFKTKFFEWVKSGKSRLWLENYGTPGAMSQFIGGIDTLNSVIEPADAVIIRAEIKEEFWNIVETMEKKP